MVKFTILNRKQLIKYLVKITIIILFIVILARLFIGLKYKKSRLEINAMSIIENSNTDLVMCLDVAMPKVSNQNRNSQPVSSRSQNRYNQLLGVELGMANHLRAIDEENEQHNGEGVALVPAQEDNNTNQALGDVPQNVATSVISEKNKTDKVTNTYGTVKIKNETDFNLTEELLTPDVELDNKKDVLLFHTHTCESYTQSEKYNYEMTGNYRTTDLNFTVSRTADELEKYLKDFGFNVLHDKTLHDYPAYTGSYGRSMETVENILKTNNNIQAIFDVHRDALGNNSDYGPCVQIGDERAAQIMFVIGTNGGGLEHPNWNQNLKYAIKVQQKADEMYPGLFKPILLSNSRYNQQLGKGAVIMEVGATGNTLDETLVSMKYFSKVLSEVMK